MKTLAVHTLKGGVGKTFLATQIAAYCAYELGLRVLCIDSDYQGSFYNWGKRHNNKIVNTPDSVTDEIIIDFLDTSVFDVFLQPHTEPSDLMGIRGLSFVNIHNLASNPNAPEDQQTFKYQDMNGMQLLLPYLKRWEQFKDSNDNQQTKYMIDNLSNFLKQNEQNFDICIIDNPPNVADPSFEPIIFSSDNLVIVTEVGQHSADGIDKQLSLLSYLMRRAKKLNVTPQYMKMGLTARGWLIGFIPNKIRDTESGKEEKEELLGKLKKGLMFIDWDVLAKDTANKEFLVDNEGDYIIKNIEGYPANIKMHKRFHEAQFDLAIFGNNDYKVQQAELRPIFFDIVSRMKVSNLQGIKNLTSNDYELLERAKKILGKEWKRIIYALWSHNEILPKLATKDVNELRNLKRKLTKTDLKKLNI